MRKLKFRAYSKSFDIMFTNAMLEMATASMVDICKEKLKKVQPESTEMKTGIFLATYDEDLKIMQYIGAKDRKGKEIYGGDVIRFVDGVVSYSDCGIEYDEFINIGRIIFDNDEMCWDVTNRNIEREEVWNGIEEIEVIGNIYENPDLLEGENNE